MRRLQQTKLNDPKTERRGNCFATVIACWLDMDILDVPNIETLFHVENDLLYLDVLNKWLYSRGKLLREAREFKCFHLKSDVERLMFEDKHGKTYLEMQAELEGQFYLVSGTSPRNHEIRHITIYKDGKLYHDPHPDGSGLYVPEGASEATSFNFQVIE